MGFYLGLGSGINILFYNAYYVNIITQKSQPILARDLRAGADKEVFIPSEGYSFSPLLSPLGGFLWRKKNLQLKGELQVSAMPLGGSQFIKMREVANLRFGAGYTSLNNSFAISMIGGGSLSYISNIFMKDKRFNKYAEVRNLITDPVSLEGESVHFYLMNFTLGVEGQVKMYKNLFLTLTYQHHFSRQHQEKIVGFMDNSDYSDTLVPVNGVPVVRGMNSNLGQHEMSAGLFWEF